MKRALTFTAALALALTLGSARSAAQITLNPYVAPFSADDGLALSRPRALHHRELSALVILDLADDPLVIERRSGVAASESKRLVHRALTDQMRFAFGLYDKLVLMGGLNATLALTGQRFSDPVTQRTIAPADGGGIGDVHLGVRYVPLEGSSRVFSLAVQGELTLPLGYAASPEQTVRGERSVSARPALLFEVQPGPYRFNATIGALIRRDDTLLGTRLGDQLTFGAGGAAQLPGDVVPVSLLAELHGNTVVRDFFGREATPVELLFGARATLREHWLVSLAAGPGLTRGAGSPDFRLLASLAFKAERVLESSPHAATGDRDSDGVPDSHDHCPDAAEDPDHFEDFNGCPDPDNDADGMPDHADKCPLEPEDQDGFNDDDGCPDR